MVCAPLSSISLRVSTRTVVNDSAMGFSVRVAVLTISCGSANSHSAVSEVRCA
jgi:hypothetical protein